MTTGKRVEELEFHFMVGYFHRQLDGATDVHSSNYAYICSVGDRKREIPRRHKTQTISETLSMSLINLFI